MITKPLKNIFDKVPERYDFLNRLLTLRLDEHWRKRAARKILEDNPRTVLDLCCGTGDLTMHLAKRSTDGMRLTGLDYSANMLDAARKKAQKQGYGDTITFIEGDAAALPFPDNCFDAVGISFAFRNITWKNPVSQKALSEMRRVTRPNGKIVVIETSQPDSTLIRAVFHFYVKIVVGRLGTLISGNKTAYRYFSTSAQNYYSIEELRPRMLESMLKIIEIKRFLFGAVALLVMQKSP